MNKKLGYYLCNGLEFDSKIKACIYSSQVNKPLDWRFNDEEFKKYNWTNEPIQTLDQLYDKRSREIREKYDYVILSYSGGSDSNNILESFIRQGLIIDEIVVNHMSKANNLSVLNTNITSNWNAGAEFELQTIPRLQYIKNVSPNTKITVLDLSDNVFDTLKSAGDASWVESRREPLNVSGATRYNYIHFNEVRKQFDRSKSIGLVLGIEKPRTYIKQNQFYILFSDKSANIASAADHLHEYDNATVEYFYWDPTAIPMMCKQAHVIKRWLEASPQYKPLWTPVDRTDLFTKHRLIHERMYRTIIYTTWDNNWFQADKAIKDWHSEMDDWFVQQYKDTKEFHIWQEGINYVAENAKNYIMIRDTSFDGLKTFLTNYFIGNMNDNQY
jgi:hypothetical protein